MYEILRNDLLVQLKDLPQEQLQFVMGVLDRTLSRYEIHREKPAPSTPQGELPELVVLYLACKKTYGLTQSSLNNYETGLRVFFRTVGKPPEQVTRMMFGFSSTSTQRAGTSRSVLLISIESMYTISSVGLKARVILPEIQ